MEAGDWVRPDPAAAPVLKVEARLWLSSTHARLSHLLPAATQRPLLTEDLVDAEGRPTNVMEHFRIDKHALPTLSGNLDGLLHTAQSAGGDDPEKRIAGGWEGFRSVEVRVTPDLTLHGLLAYAEEDGQPRDADCIVLLPGLYGHNQIVRTHDIAQALLTAGHHVLAVELRGHGETDKNYPDVFYNFGVLETADLLAVSRWIEERPHIRRTGLIGFCWGANHGMLAAWQDGCGLEHPSISPYLLEHLKLDPDHHHFTAGILAFSPALDFEDLCDRLESSQSMWTHPALAAVQDVIRRRMTVKGLGPSDGSLHTLIEREFAHSELNGPDAVQDGVAYLRFRPYNGLPDGNKLKSVRTPLLIVHAANDPVFNAQTVADLMAGVDNPNVAALILPGGGHIGFAPYAREYFYSLILNFFDPRSGPAADPSRNVDGR